MRILFDRTLRRWGQCIWTTVLLLLPCIHLHAASVIQFSTEAYEVAEDAGAVEISVQRIGDLMAPVSVEFATDDQYSATPGTDYTPIVTHLVFLAGETNKIVSVPILNDAEVEGPEVFQVVLRQPGAGAALGPRSSATVTIIDNDRGLRLEFGSVHEDEGAVQVRVSRGDDGSVPVRVQYWTQGHTALAGEDYVETTGNLDFAVGEESKYIMILILNDLEPETREGFWLRFSVPTAAGRYLATISIVDDDTDRGVAFDSQSSWLLENHGPITVKVFRNNDLDLGAFTVDYATSDGMATAGQDYGEIKGTLSFAPGELVKLLTIPITEDALAELDEDFTVTLSNPTGGAFLGTNASSRVTIVDSTVNPLVPEMIGQVQQAALTALMKQLTGDEPVLVGGEVYLLSTRNTRSGVPIEKANQYAFEGLQSFGLDVRYQNWQGLTNRNVLAVLPGESHPEEIVVVCAHLDDMPEVGRAPGADDNASGSAAVLMAARILSQCRFGRSIHFVLFTGEEQGLLGSSHYVADAYAGGSNIVGAVVLDMIGYDPLGSHDCFLYCRVEDRITYPSDVGRFPNSLIAASLFTNVVSTCGLSDSLDPIIAQPSGWGWFPLEDFPVSDYGPFWSADYPGVWVQDATGYGYPRLHSTNDILSALNFGYFTTMVKAIVGTVAQLAHPHHSTPVGVLEVANSDWSPGSGIGARILHAKHAAGASEIGTDEQDIAWSTVPTNANSKWLMVHTDPDGVPLQTDARPETSETIFHGKLSVGDAAGTGVSCSNQLRFTFLTPPDPKRIYLARIHVDSRYVQGSVAFDCVTNLQEVVAAGGFVQLPNLANVPDGAVYGTCDVSARFLHANPANCRLRLDWVSEQSVQLTATAQLGVQIIDDLEVRTNLAPGNDWTLVKSYTNYVSPDAAHFEAGWTDIVREFDPSRLPASEAHFLRLKRTWIHL